MTAPTRYIFRMTYYADLAVFLRDGQISSKNHPNPQQCHQTSYADIVNRRGEAEMALPCGSLINDFVSFYFSPRTAMAFAIHRGNVDLRSPVGDVLRKASMDDRIFFISNVNRFVNCDQSFWFSDLACNSMAPPPKYENDLSLLETHIDWQVFDESPIVGKIPEIGYNGVCKWFHDKDDPVERQNRSRKRMAEFMVKNELPLGMIDCIVVKTTEIKSALDVMMLVSSLDIPIFVKPGCYN